MAKMNLNRAYTYAGKTYGPGEVDVPDGDAADSLKQKEESFANYLKDHEAPAPVTPSSTQGLLHDPRKLPTGPQNGDVVTGGEVQQRRNLAQDNTSRKSHKPDDK